MNNYYPLKLSSVIKSPIWGGTRLLEHWNKTASAATVGESWELTVRREERSTVLNKAYAGKTLNDLIADDRAGIMGMSSMPNDAFPLLVKLIDANDRLSVQVHPDDDYAARVENDRGKTEIWYIVEAEEGAEIICGLLPGTTAEDYAKAVHAGDYQSLLRRQKVKPGETYFIPSGLPHAIGAGILIAEIQQNCDLTYRVYDYDRLQKDGTLRELHVDKALDVIRPFAHEEIEAIRYSRLNGEAHAASLLADCTYFRVEHLNNATTLAPSPYLRHLLVLAGNGALAYNGISYPLQKGDSYLLPASLGTMVLAGNCECLLSVSY